MQTMQGRTYSKTIIQQGGVDIGPSGPATIQLVVSQIQGLPWRSTAVTRIGDPNAAPVNLGGPVPTQLTIKPVIGLPWWSLCIKWIGDPNATPVLTPAPVQSVIRPLPWRSLCINRIGDPNAAPASTTATASPLVYSPLFAQAAMSKILMSASAADFTFSGPVISTPIPQKTYAPFVGILTPRDSSNFTTTTAAPVVVSNFIQPPRLFRALIQQVFAPPTGGPTESFGATVPTFVVGITRRTAVLADALRSTLAKGVTLDRGPQRVIGVTRTTTTTRSSLRSTLTSYVTRLTSSIFNGRSTKVK